MAAPRWRAPIALFGLALAFAAPAAAQKFYPDDPLLREPPPLPAPDPGPRTFSVLIEAASATFGRPGERQPAKGVIAAQGVNTLGEVLDSAWYVNRHGSTRMSLADLVRGSGENLPPSMAGPWHVLLLKNESLRSTIVIRDVENRTYLLRFDSRDAPEQATGAEIIGSRFFHALGYYVPEKQLVTFARAQLLIDTSSARSCQTRSIACSRTSRAAVTAHTGPSPHACRATACRWSDRISCTGLAATTRMTSWRTNTVGICAVCRSSRRGSITRAWTRSTPSTSSSSRLARRHTSAITSMTSWPRWAAASTPRRRYGKAMTRSTAGPRR